MTLTEPESAPPTEVSRPAGGRRKRRRGWLWTGTVFLWGLASFLFAYRYLQSELFQRNLRDWVLPYLSQALSADIRCDRMQIDLFAGRAAVYGLTLSKKGAEVPPFLEIQKVDARFQWGISWGKGRFALGAVRVERPVLRLHLLGPEKDNLPRSSAPRGKGRLVETIFRASFQQAEIYGGVVELREWRLPIEMALHDLQLDLDLQQQGLYLGSLRFSRGSMQAGRWKGEDLGLESKIEFVPQGVRFREATVRYGPSEVRFSGQLENLYAPELDLTFEALAGMEQIQDSFRLNPLFSGPVKAEGRLLLQNGLFETRGRFSSPEIRFQGLTALEAEGEFALTRSRLSLQAIQTRILGGKARGQFVYDWGNEKPLGRGEFQAESVSMQKSLQDLLRMKWPSLSRADGDLSFGWDGDAADWRMDARVQLKAPGGSENRTEPTEPEPRLDPSGAIDFTFQRGQVQISRLDLTFPRGSRAKADGFIGIRQPSSLTVDFLSPLLAESLQLIRQLSGKGDLLSNTAWMPAGIREMRFQGRMSGMVSNPEVEGTLEIAQPHWAYSSWDSFRALVRRTPQRLNLDSMLLSGPAGQILASLAIPPPSTDGSVWQLQGSAGGLRLESLIRRPGDAGLLLGQLDSSFLLQGGDGFLRGSAQATLSDVSAIGIPLGSLESTVRLENSRVSLDLQSRSQQDSFLEMHGFYDTDTAAFAGKGEARSLPLRQISYLADWKERLDGRLDLSFEGEGDITRPRLQGQIRSPAVMMIGQALQSLESRWSWSGKEVRWGGTGRLPAGKLGWDSSIRWDGAEPLWSAEVQVDHFDLLQVMPDSARESASQWSSQAAGRISVSGPFLQPARWSLEALFPGFDLTFNTLSFQAQQPLKARYAGGRLEIEKTGFSTKAGQLALSGSVDTASSAPLNLRISSQLDLQAFESWMGGAALKGKSNLEIAVQGTPQSPRLRGTCRLENVSLNAPGLDYSIDNLSGDLFFDGNSLRASNVKGAFAGGTLSASGNAQLDRAVLAGFLLNIRLAKVQLRVPQGFRTVSNADLIWRGNLERHSLSGEIRVQEAEYNRHADLFRDFSVLFPLARTGSRKQEILDRLALDLQIRFDNGMEIRTDTIRLEADSNLRLLGPASGISLLGRISATSGELTFLGNNYEITKGGVEFVNPLHIEPIFDLSAMTTVHGYRINLQLTGRPDSIKPDMRSEPPLPMLDLLTLLSTGVTSQELLGRASEGGNVGMAASSLLAQGLSQQVESRMQRLLGFRQFRIDPFLSSRSNNPTARVTLERRVQKNLSLTYSTDLTSAQQNIILVEYFFNPDYSLIASRDEKGQYGLDLRIQRRF